MILSMTGYGTASAQRDDLIVSVEIRTVNHRFLDLHTRISREYLFLEGDIQKSARNMLDRGRVEVNVSIQHTGPTVFTVNENLVKGYLEAAEKLQKDYSIEGSLDMRTALNLPGILQNQESIPDGMTDTLSGMAKSCMQSALEGVIQMRRQEGKQLQADMMRYLKNIGESVNRIKALSEKAAAETLQKLLDRISQLIPQAGVPIDPQRLAQEAAFIVDKADITEEVTRLKSHVEQYRLLMDSNEKAGKKLDFLLQEFQRETNTILSKSGNLEIAKIAISIKTDIEKLREQVQNVE
jgi:uncharacterized protein (TIGR00255 family)